MHVLSYVTRLRSPLLYPFVVLGDLTPLQVNFSTVWGPLTLGARGKLPLLPPLLLAALVERYKQRERLHYGMPSTLSCSVCSQLVGVAYILITIMQTSVTLRNANIHPSHLEMKFAAVVLAVTLFYTRVNMLKEMVASLL